MTEEQQIHTKGTKQTRCDIAVTAGRIHSIAESSDSLDSLSRATSCIICWNIAPVGNYTKGKYYLAQLCTWTHKVCLYECRVILLLFQMEWGVGSKPLQSQYDWSPCYPNLVWLEPMLVIHVSRTVWLEPMLSKFGTETLWLDFKAVTMINQIKMIGKLPSTTYIQFW